MLQEVNPNSKLDPKCLNPFEVREVLQAIRYTDVQPVDRIAHKGLLYNIHAVLPDRVSGQDYLTLMCGQGVNDG